MKKVFLTSITLLLLLSSCNNNQNNKSSNNKINEEVENSKIPSSKKSEYQFFQDYGIAVKLPCILEDVSNQTNADFDLNYGGIDNANNKEKLAAYQLMIIKLPVGYKDLSPEELNEKVDIKLKEILGNLQNLKSVYFGYENYPGYVVETSHNGYSQKAITFHKENFIYCLTVMTNDNLEERFNNLTNNIKFLDTKNHNNFSESNNTKNTTLKNNLKETYSNQYFSIRHPSSWEIVQKNNQITEQALVSVQIMEKQKNDIEFRPNINIIVGQKRLENTTLLAEIGIKQNKTNLPDYRVISVKNDILLGNYKGTKVEQSCSLGSYKLNFIQYVLKKPDNTTYVVTGTFDTNRAESQRVIVNEIINSLNIK